MVRIAAHVQGETLQVEVTDSGIGLEPERLRTIFSPGYTTKPQGSGWACTRRRTTSSEREAASRR